MTLPDVNVLIYAAEEIASASGLPSVAFDVKERGRARK
jgi:hypothetical protein